MPTLVDLRAELELLSLEQLREFRAGDYAESLSDYSKAELRQLVYDIWTKDGCKALAAMTKDEVVEEIVDDIDTSDLDETVDDEITLFIDAVRRFAIEGDPTE
jgi:hypothetical protein